MNSTPRRLTALFLTLAGVAGLAAHAAAQDSFQWVANTDSGTFAGTLNPPVCFPLGAIDSDPSSSGMTITDTGAGTLTLNGNNSFSGGTIISTGSGSILISNPVLLGGTGIVTINGNVGSLNPNSNGPATLTLGSTATVVTGSAGTLTPIDSGTLTITDSGATLSTGSGTLQLTAANTLVFTTSAIRSPGLEGPSGIIKASPVPEPSTWALLLTGLVLLAGWRRAQRS